MDTSSSSFSVKKSDMLNAIKPSGIRKMFARAQGLEGVISLGIGAPDLMPPAGLLESVSSNQQNQRAHGYTLNSGIMELRQKIVDQYKEEYNLDFTTNGVVTGAGATQLMYGAFFAYNNPGDEVLVPDPGFVYYPTIPMMAGSVVKPVPLDDHFQMDLDVLNEKINEKTKMIIINTPGNPTGAYFNEQTVKGLADIAIDNNLIIFSDEVYEFIIFDGQKHVPMARYAPDNTITLNSFSKTYCVPGWRLGYAVASDELIAPLNTIHPFMVANPPSLSQYAIADFMGTDEDRQYRANMRKEMEHRRNVVNETFGKIPGVEIPKVSGSFYAFPKIKSEFYTSDNPGEEFVEDVFENAKVVMVPGSEFGETRDDHFRISFGSANEDKLRESADRIIKHVETK